MYHLAVSWKTAHFFFFRIHNGFTILPTTYEYAVTATYLFIRKETSQPHSL